MKFSINVCLEYFLVLHNKQYLLLWRASAVNEIRLKSVKKPNTFILIKGCFGKLRLADKPFLFAQKFYVHKNTSSVNMFLYFLQPCISSLIRTKVSFA